MDVAQKLGRAHFESGNTSQAKEWFEKTLSLDRNNTAAITNLGRLALDEQDYASAINFLGRKNFVGSFAPPCFNADNESGYVLTVW